MALFRPFSFALLGIALASCGVAAPLSGGIGEVLDADGRKVRSAWRFVQRARLQVSRPAFLRLERLRPSGPESLLVSTFGVMGKADGVHAWPDAAAVLTRPEARPQQLARGVVWPNEAIVLPAGAFGKYDMVVAGGFLVPGKTGALTLIDLPEPGQSLEPGRILPGTVRPDDPSAGPMVVYDNETKITRDRAGWFYHRTVVRDMDGDGRLDLLTARARKGMGGSEGELVWLRQPAARNARGPVGPWAETVIAKGPDVHFRVEDLDGDGQPEILATEFFSRKLTLLWQVGGAWQRRVLDDTLGSAFDLDLVDLDGDGKRDLLVTNHEADAKAAVFAYTVPADFRTASWPRHVLLSGIKTRNGGMNQASPGQAVAFQPEPARPASRPWIVVGGDGSQRAHLLEPVDARPGTWSYRERILADVGCTVGQCAVGDVDGDGRSEIFVPAYDKDTIHVFGVAAATGR
ncbi:MAG: VCBS repeat-containing protein [Candidatus Sericytochromatia bacterium]|nr:VCBS repeat-containing protein [Candidatus Sericytochromatia bacterium]